MENRQEMTKEERTRRILEAAAAEFGENGYARTTVRGIAARAGSSAAVINKYFDSKESLFGQVLDAMPREAFFAAGTKLTLREMLNEALLRLPALKRRDPVAFRFFTLMLTDPELPADCKEKFRAAFERSDARRALEAAQRAGALPAGDPYKLFTFCMRALCDFADLRETMGLGLPDPESMARALGLTSAEKPAEKPAAPAPPDGEERRALDRRIIAALSSEYISLACVDLETGRVTPYALGAAGGGPIVSALANGVTHNEIHRMYAEIRVHPDDRERVLEAGRIGSLFRELSRRKSFTTVFRNAEGRYCEMKFIKLDPEEELPRSVVVAYADRDAEIRSREEAARSLRRNMEIIGVLASEYAYMAYVDLTTDEITPYTMEAGAGSLLRAELGYTDAFREYVNLYVHPDDREKLLRAGSLYHIADALNDRKSFTVTYRRMRAGGVHICEMKMVKVGEDAAEPTEVALALADRGAE